METFTPELCVQDTRKEALTHVITIVEGHWRASTKGGFI